MKVVRLKQLMMTGMAWGVFFLLPLVSHAQDLGEEGAAGGDPYKSLAAALAIGLAAFGGALGQGKTAATALEGIARNPSAQGKIFVPMIIGLALIESLVIYALLIAFNLV